MVIWQKKISLARQKSKTSTRMQFAKLQKKLLLLYAWFWQLCDYVKYCESRMSLCVCMWHTQREEEKSIRITRFRRYENAFSAIIEQWHRYFILGFRSIDSKLKPTHFHPVFQLNKQLNETFSTSRTIYLYFVTAQLTCCPKPLNLTKGMKYSTVIRSQLLMSWYAWNRVIHCKSDMVRR